MSTMHIPLLQGVGVPPEQHPEVYPDYPSFYHKRYGIEGGKESPDGGLLVEFPSVSATDSATLPVWRAKGKSDSDTEYDSLTVTVADTAPEYKPGEVPVIIHRLRWWDSVTGDIFWEREESIHEDEAGECTLALPLGGKWVLVHVKNSTPDAVHADARKGGVLGRVAQAWEDDESTYAWSLAASSTNQAVNNMPLVKLIDDSVSSTINDLRDTITELNNIQTNSSYYEKRAAELEQQYNTEHAKVETLEGKERDYQSQIATLRHDLEEAQKSGGGGGGAQGGSSGLSLPPNTVLLSSLNSVVDPDPYDHIRKPVGVRIMFTYKGASRMSGIAFYNGASRVVPSEDATVTPNYLYRFPYTRNSRQSGYAYETIAMLVTADDEDTAVAYIKNLSAIYSTNKGNSGFGSQWDNKLHALISGEALDNPSSLVYFLTRNYENEVTVSCISVPDTTEEKEIMASYLPLSEDSLSPMYQAIKDEFSLDLDLGQMQETYVPGVAGSVYKHVVIDTYLPELF